MILCDKEELDRAINEFNRAIELDHRLAIAYANRGLAFLRRHKDAEAERDLERAITLNPALKEDVELHIERVKKWRQTNR